MGISYFSAMALMALNKEKKTILKERDDNEPKYYVEPEVYAERHYKPSMVAETMSTYNTPAELEKLIAQTKQAMLDAAKDLEFLEAARLRDEMIKLQNELLKMKK